MLPLFLLAAIDYYAVTVVIALVIAAVFITRWLMDREARLVKIEKALTVSK